MSDEGLRYNEGKLRFGLISPFAKKCLTEVLEFGAKKYTPDNWKKGMRWSKVVESLERHLEAIKNGEDYDQESKILHAGHLLCNGMFLAEYYDIYPQGDDRNQKYLKPKRIGLDIDEVLADFIGAYCERYNMPTPTNWHFDRKIIERMNELSKDKEFWINLKPLVTELPFEPVCYITTRPVPKEWCEEWLDKFNFPAATVFVSTDKTTIAKEQKLDIFVDDKFETFQEINNNGILCYLMDASHNRKYKVGHKRITNLNQII